MAVKYLAGNRLWGTNAERLAMTTGATETLGSSADGTLIGDPAQDTTPTPPTGLGTSSFYFDGSDDMINIDGAEPFSTTVGSISAWVSFGSSQDNTFLSFGDTDANEYLALRADGASLFALMRASSGNQWETYSGGMGTDTWHHVVLSQDGTAVKFYVDGTEITSFAVDTDKSKWMLTGIDNGRIGGVNKNSSGNTDFFNGNIMEVGLWNVALTSTQVSSLYGNGGSTAKKANTESTGLRAYYPLSGTTVTNEAELVYPNLKNGTTFLTSDTNKLYMWNGTDTWNEVS